MIQSLNTSAPCEQIGDLIKRMTRCSVTLSPMYHNLSIRMLVQTGYLAKTTEDSKIQAAQASDQLFHTLYGMRQKDRFLLSKENKVGKSHQTGEISRYIQATVSRKTSTGLDSSNLLLIQTLRLRNGVGWQMMPCHLPR